MNYLDKVEFWGEAHHPKYLDILRVAFGVFLIFKGIEFANNMQYMSELVGREVAFSSFMVMLLVHYIIFAHIVGGFMIAVGLLTRVGVWIQLPIVICSFFFIGWGVLAHLSQVLSTLLILGLGIIFIIEGSGPWSLDNFLSKEEGGTHEHVRPKA
ncbi:MAG: DoxX family protein [Candidatus Dadabacteria bacterium]